MLVEVISKYLLSNKRLVVPNLGTFIVKKTGENVLFSNLIKSDDGVLRRLLVEAGISELEAAGLIDRFVFEVNYRLQNEGRCAIDGFGTFASGANGSIAFEYNTLAVGENLEGNIPERRAQEAAVKTEESSHVYTEEKKAEDSVSRGADDAAEQKQPMNAEQKDVTRVQTEVTESSEAIRNTDAASVTQTEVKNRNKVSNATAIYGDSVEASRKVRPEKYAKGLRYGKGHKVVTGRESATARRSSKGDIIIKIAIFVAALAIMALMYGLYNDWQAGKIDLFGGGEQTSQIGAVNDIFEDVPDEMGGMRNPDLDYITPQRIIDE